MVTFDACLTRSTPGEPEPADLRFPCNAGPPSRAPAGYGAQMKHRVPNMRAEGFRACTIRRPRFISGNVQRPAWGGAKAEEQRSGAVTPERVGVSAGHSPALHWVKIGRLFEFMPLSCVSGRIRTCAHGSGGRGTIWPRPAETCLRETLLDTYWARGGKPQVTSLPTADGLSQTGERPSRALGPPTRYTAPAAAGMACNVDARAGEAEA
jgi:hypothetical protein